MFSSDDLALFEAKGITPEQVEAQLKRFETGFPYLKIKSPASPASGITVLSEEEEAVAVARWKEYLADGGEVCKFVPASGAASRMFKALFAFVDGEDEHPAEGSPVAKLIADIEKTAFYPDLTVVTERLYGKTPEALRAEGRDKELIAAIIKPEGLNYGALPKGLLKFHAYA